MNRNLLLASGFVVLLVIVFFASLFDLPGRLDIGTRQKNRASINNGPSHLSGIPQSTEQSTPTPAIDWQSIRVPEPGETPADKDTAVPKYTYGTNFGGTIRSFEISGNQDAFSPGKVIVYQGDIVRIYLTSADKTYDMTVADYGNSMKVSAGENKLLEFQAATAGRFSLTCSLCNQGKTTSESKGPMGILLVKPKS